MAEHLSSRQAHAFVLINTDPTRTASVVERLATIPNARVVEVLGPYDIIVELESEAPEYITQMLREKIRPVPGVTSTVTCTWMD